MDQLLGWATKQGVECSGVGGSSYRGLYAAEDILPGGKDMQPIAFVKIPQQLLLHAGLCSCDCTFGQAFNKLKTDAGIEMDDRHLLCLLLIVERAKGINSEWHPYISYLPQTYADPLWWKDDEVKMLAGTRLGIAVKEHVKIVGRLTRWRDRLVELQRAAPDTAGSELLEQAADGWPLSDRAVLWAKSTVWSRAFNIPYLGGVDKPGVALLPVGDLLDHDPVRHVAWHTGPTGTDPFSFISCSPIRKGELLYSNYGNKSNEELILGYGFALPNNLADFFHIMIGFGQKPSAEPGSSGAVPDERVVQRQALLHRLGLSTSHYLKLQTPAGAGLQHTALGLLQSPQVAIQQLLNTACICLMPDHLAYQWWSAPATVSHSGHFDQAQELHARAATVLLDIPGQVEVRRISASAVHNPISIRNAQAANPSLALQHKTPSTDPTVILIPSEGTSKGGQGSSEGDAVRQERQEGSPKGSDGGPFECSPVHVQLQVLHSLRLLLTSKLVAIAGGTAEEDQNLAQQPGCSHAAGMALGYRAGQKQIAAAALAALASTAAEVVQRAVAGLGLGSSRPSSVEQKWQQGLDVQYHKVQEAHFPGSCDTSDSAQQQPQTAAAPCNQSRSSWAARQWGLTTTAAVHPGDVLLSVPRQSLVTIASHPDQTLLQMASLAFDQAPSWYSTAASLELGTRALPQAAASHGRAQLVEAGKGVQTEADGSQGVGEKLVEAGKGAQAEADGSQGVVVKLVEAWLQPGKVELTLPGRLLMAQLWPEHEASGFGHQCIQALSGLPVELEVMAEAEEALQKLQRLLPQLQELMGLQMPSCQAGEGRFRAHVALLWAMTCMERCSRSDPSGQGLLLAPAVSALPQELLGVVADLEWDAITKALTLRAACSLPAKTPLTPALTAVRADPDHLIATQGWAALSWAQKGRQQQQAAQSSLQGQGSVQMPWQTPDAASFQLCIEPPEEDECRERKLQLLAASALGTAHALTATSSQERLLAALALCSCDSAGLSQLGSGALLQAFHDSANAAREHTQSAASSTQQNLLDKAEQALQDQQTQLVEKLLVDRALQEVAQVTLVSLLEAEMLQITSGEESSDSDAWPEQNHTHVSMHTLAEYRRGTAHILEVQLIKAALLDTGPRKKQKSRSKKRKHKQSSQSDGA